MINIIKPNKLTLSKIKNNKYSMSPLNYREIGIKSTKQSKICSLLSDSDSKFVRGYETGSNCYVKNSNLAFIRPSNINRESPIVDKDSLIYLKPSVKDKDRIVKHEEILLVTDANISDTAIFLDLHNKDVNNEYVFSSGLVKLNVNPNVDKYYLLALLRDDYFKEQLLVLTPKGATIKHSGDKFLECYLPYSDNEWVIKKLSNLMKNVCYMEYLCREKLLKIFSIYDKELSLHSSNAKKNLISKFITHKRIDAGFYSPLVNNFFSKLDIIGSYTLKDLDFSIKRGPNLAKRDLGRSIQTSVANEKYYRLIYPSDISNSGYITKEIYLGTANKIWLLSKGDILFSGEGNVGKTFIICNEMKFTTNFHGLIVRPNFVDNDLTKSIFIGSFLYYMKHIGVMDRLSVGGQGGSFAIQYWDILKFPKISNESLSRIVKLYNSYHDIDLFSFDFEKLNEIGVSQINELRIKCNNLISSILNDLKNNSLKEESDYTV